MRGKLRKMLLVVLGGLVVLAAALWVVLTQPLLSRPRALSPPPVDPGRLTAHVRALSEDCHPRDFLHPENLDRAAAYIRDALAAAGGRVAERTYEVGGRTYRNVSAFYGPESGPRIVVGAHYDTAGPLPGADDNASAVAGLLELARLLNETPPAAPVELVAFTLEEPPFFRTPEMGSAVHAHDLVAAGVVVRLMICLEMIGYFRDEPGSQGYPVGVMKAIYPDRGDYIAVVGKLGQEGVVRRVKRAMRDATPLPVQATCAPSAIPGVDFSDHLNYWAAGMDAVMITDTAFYRNPHYHQPTDTWDTLDYGRLAQVVQGIHQAVRDHAGR